jgi:hypothetical protein
LQKALAEYIQIFGIGYPVMAVDALAFLRQKWIVVEPKQLDRAYEGLEESMDFENEQIQSMKQTMEESMASRGSRQLASCSSGS